MEGRSQHQLNPPCWREADVAEKANQTSDEQRRDSATHATTLLIGYTPIESKKFKVTNKKNQELPLLKKRKKANQ